MKWAMQRSSVKAGFPFYAPLSFPFDSLVLRVISLKPKPSIAVSCHFPSPLRGPVKEFRADGCSSRICWPYLEKITPILP